MWHSISVWLITKLTAVLGIILSKIFSNAGSLIAKDLANELYNKKALQYVKELNRRDDLTSAQKAIEFNKMFLQWLSASGKVLATSTINLLREMAVTYFKSLKLSGESEGK